MLGVDRLDMVKGIPQKLLAYEKFLEEHPEWRDKVLLVQIAVPSRTDVPEYQKLRCVCVCVCYLGGWVSGCKTMRPKLGKLECKVGPQSRKCVEPCMVLL